ncbi:M23 family metallopeptidase [Streptomyces sp. NBC_00028]|uniref:M23 family metallopeptidase n=1 Tax=Streptomyces sp. NBC_00028 TaxID=2975624 RepID=UPI0038636F0C
MAAAAAAGGPTPEPGRHPGRGPLAGPQRPHHYPAFGAPVLAPGDGVVVATGDSRRDHLTRTSVPGYAHLRRGSLRVAVGDRVTVGEQLAKCGNS